MTKKAAVKRRKIDDAELIRLFTLGFTNDEIAEKIAFSPSTVVDHRKKLGLRYTTRHFITKPDAFADINAESCYWAGFIAADGCISDYTTLTVGLAIIDAYHIQSLCRFVGRDEMLNYREITLNGKKFKGASVAFRSQKLVQDLATNFCIVPCKSLILEPPKLSLDMVQHFIRGFFDGDGCISWHKESKHMRLDFCSGSKQFLEWIRETLRKLFINIGHRKIRKSKETQTYRLDFSGEMANKILIWMYQNDGNLLCLRRKYDRLINYTSRREEILTQRVIQKSKKQEEVNVMMALYSKGFSYQDVANELGISYQAVSYHLHKSDIPKRSGSINNLAGQKLKQRNQEILKARLSGTTVDSLMEQFNLSQRSIYLILDSAKRAQNDLSTNG